jgi:uncharacterized protein (DUF1015 family)
MLDAFHALRYDTKKAGALSTLVTEPYDKISPELKERYLATNPYNVVRLIRGETGPGDALWQDRAAELWRSWRAAGVIVRDPESSYSIYEQTFTAPDGVRRTRTSLVGALDLDARARVLHHERTHAKPKADRRRLLETTGVPFGLIFLLRHQGPAIDRSLLARAELFGEAQDGDGTLHRFSTLTDRAACAALTAAYAASSFVIADGHHRFTVACEHHDAHPELPLARYVLASAVELDDPGLVILPTHRVVRGLPSERTGGLAPLLQRLGARPFASAADPAAFLEAVARAGSGTAGVATRHGFYLWTLGAPGAPDDVSALDTHRLHAGFLDPLLRDLPAEEIVSYRRSARAAVEDVAQGGADVAFILNPVTPRTVCAVAARGGVMPQKSTDFYPKMLDGFVFLDTREKAL